MVIVARTYGAVLIKVVDDVYVMEDDRKSTTRRQRNYYFGQCVSVQILRGDHVEKISKGGKRA